MSPCCFMRWVRRNCTWKYWVDLENARRPSRMLWFQPSLSIAWPMPVALREVSHSCLLTEKRLIKHHPYKWQLAVALGMSILLSGCTRKLSAVKFSQSAQTIEGNDFVEVTANVSWPRAHNPYTD